MEGSESSTAASRQTLASGDNESATSLLHNRKNQRQNLSEVTKMEYTTVAILCFVNLINYMDRFTLAGNLSDVRTTFQVTDDKLGLLQTVFVLSYMVFAPLFGYLGDRYSRRIIMACGVALWALTTFVGSFLQDFGWFMAFRCMVGIGEASYSTIAPTIISDMFVGNVRSNMLAVFYFAIPVGSGLGYIVGAQAAVLLGGWRWGLRVTPVLGLVAVLLICLLLIEPERGAAEESQMQPTSYKDDIAYLLRNPSFMLSTLAFTCVAFVTGALAWWGPNYIYEGYRLQPGMADIDKSKLSLVFGGVTMAAGLVGVPLGTWLGARLVGRFPRAHPLVCGAGLLASAPPMALALHLADRHPYAPFALMFVASVALNLNWAIVCDISLYVVVPPRRSTAEAMQILISHMFGDAGSPYLIGLASEYLRTKLTSEGLPVDYAGFKGLQYSLFTTSFVEVVGGALFLMTAAYIVRDKMLVDEAIHEARNRRAEPQHEYAQDTNSDDPVVS